MKFKKSASITDKKGDHFTGLKRFILKGYNFVMFFIINRYVYNLFNYDDKGLCIWTCGQ